MDLKDRIDIYYMTLTKTERTIYQSVLSNPKLISKLSIQKAAAEFGVSIASIQRFVKKIGYQGYPEFKLDISKYINTKQSTSVSQTRLQRMINSYIQTFNTLQQMDLEIPLNDLASAMHKYYSIKAIGIGNSALSAEQLVYSMYSENRFIEAVTDKIKVDYLENAMTSDNLLIIFSVTGSTDSYLSILQSAKKKNITTFLITMNSESPLIKYAGTTLILPTTHINDSKNTPYQIDNRTILYSFSEVISYYYATTKINN